jgi:hypothetical protein
VNVQNQHEQLVSLLDGLDGCAVTEERLRRQLIENQQLRAAYDKKVHDILVIAEAEPLSAAGFRELLKGIHHRVAASLARHSLREEK